MADLLRLIEAGFLLGLGWYLAASLMNTAALLIQRYFLGRAAAGRIASTTKLGSPAPTKFYRPVDRNAN